MHKTPPYIATAWDHAKFWWYGRVALDQMNIYRQTVEILEKRTLHKCGNNWGTAIINGWYKEGALYCISWFVSKCEQCIGNRSEVKTITPIKLAILNFLCWHQIIPPTIINNCYLKNLYNAISNECQTISWFKLMASSNGQNITATYTDLCRFIYWHVDMNFNTIG